MDDVAEPDLRVLVVTGGHPFEMEPFLDVFREMEGISWEHVQPPEARELFRGDKAGLWDAIVCYDMQGIVFRKPDPPRFESPPAHNATGIVARRCLGSSDFIGRVAWTGWTIAILNQIRPVREAST